MRLGALYETSVILAVFGGWTVAGLIVLRLGFHRWSSGCWSRGPTTDRARQQIRDGVLIAVLATPSQLGISVLPFLYSSPINVPWVLAEACVMCAITTLVLWVWGLTKTLPHLTHLEHLRPAVLLPVLLPFWVTIPVAAGFALGLVH